MSGITVEDWKRAIARVDEQRLESDAEVVTTMEFARMIGRERNMAAMRLKRLVQAGLAVQTKKFIRREIDGVVQPVVAYRLLKGASDGPHDRSVATVPINAGLGRDQDRSRGRAGHRIRRGRVRAERTKANK